MKSLRIFFGDLTHDTVGLATEVFPLNIAFVAAYCKKVHGDAVDIRLFKYIPLLEEAIERDPPDILALSNYPWCHNADKALCELLARRRPESLRFLGGPNFPHDAQGQKAFLVERPWIDAYVYLDGEVGFSKLVTLIRSTDSFTQARKLIRTTPVDGCVQLSATGETLVPSSRSARLLDLDEIPSPYLTGLLDPFFDGRLSPMLQTNRGCPFQCTFCHDGTEAVNRVTQFNLERVKAEIYYIAERVPKNTHSLFISDLNFGMYKRDLEICKAISGVQQRYGYPRYIDTTTGKNQKARVISAIEQLAGALRMTMSVQSMTPSVLKNIKRDNIRLDDFVALEPSLRRAKLQTVSEVILGLPGETLETHLTVIGNLLDSNIEAVVPYTLMMINGAEMNTAAQRKKWDIKTKFRIIPRDFTRLRNGRSIVEIEEVAIATNTMSFSDYVEARKIAILMRWVNNLGMRALLRLLIERKIGIMRLLKRMNTALSSEVYVDPKSAPVKLAQLFRSFQTDTVDELWDSADEIEEFFQDPEHFLQLVDGVHGKNLIVTYEAAGYARVMPEIIDCVFYHARILVEEQTQNPIELVKFDQIEHYCRGKAFNLFGGDRLDTVPEFDLTYDVDGWLSDPDLHPLEYFATKQPRRVRFVITPQQFQIVEDVIEQFGRNALGLGKVITRVNPDTLWRRTETGATTAHTPDLGTTIYPETTRV
jgi:radical SAM superfamily enzyme YgiQ (UPF0313 family)